MAKVLTETKASWGQENRSCRVEESQRELTEFRDGKRGRCPRPCFAPTVPGPSDASYPVEGGSDDLGA